MAYTKEEFLKLKETKMIVDFPEHLVLDLTQEQDQVIRRICKERGIKVEDPTVRESSKMINSDIEVISRISSEDSMAFFSVPCKCGKLMFAVQTMCPSYVVEYAKKYTTYRCENCDNK